MYKYATNILEFKLNVITSQFRLVNLFEFFFFIPCQKVLYIRYILTGIYFPTEY